MFNRLITAGKQQYGFTLIEVVIAIAIFGLVGSGIAAITTQMFSVNAQSVANVTTLKQVENVIYWVNRDAQMAQSVQPTTGDGFPLVLSWTEWDGTSHQVTYNVNSSSMQRSHSINGGAAANITLAQNIDGSASLTNCQFTGGNLTVKITSTLSGFRPVSATRTMKVTPRPVA